MKKILSIVILISFFIPQPSYARIKGELWTCIQNLACDDYNKVRNASYTASSTLAKKYSVINVTDGLAKTAWCEGKKDSGIGEYIDVSFKKSVKIVGIMIAPGYTKSKSTYANNNRLKSFTLQLNNDKLKIPVQVLYYNPMDGSSNPNNKWTEIASPQLVMLDKPVMLKNARLTIDSVDRGSKYNDTCISTLEFVTSYNYN